MVSPKRAMINNCTFRKSPVTATLQQLYGDFTATLRGVVGDFYAGSRSFEELA